MRRIASRFLPLVPLAGCASLALAPALAALAGESSAQALPTAAGMTIAVSNCNDRGPGSLRAAVAGALSGDTIDMTGLACRRINLTSGAIRIPQDDLSLVGRGTTALTIDANRLSRVFRHSGTGWLRIRGMTIARGFYRDNSYPRYPHGGCLYSAGSIELKHSLVHWCRVQASGRYVYALGGGLYAAGEVTLTNSQVLSNRTEHTNTTPGYTRGLGGGIYALGRLTTRHSRICGNHAHDAGGGAWSVGIDANHTTISENSGGALYSIYGRDIVIANSTISGNKGTYPILTLSYPGGRVLIVNSTISSNTSLGASPNVSINAGTQSIINSTIVSNQRTGYAYDCYSTAAVRMGGWKDESTHIESSVIANNFCGDNTQENYDIGAGPYTRLVIEGANNLITRTWNVVILPPDTISANPRLAPLANNGGRTKTHALLDDSPAIDAGNNAAGLAYDQRGSDYPRVKGAQADIGAYER